MVGPSSSLHWGGLLGAKMATKMSNVVLERVFGVALFLISLKMISAKSGIALGVTEVLYMVGAEIAKKIFYRKNRFWATHLSVMQTKMEPSFPISLSSWLSLLLLYGKSKSSPVDEKETKPHH